MPGYINFSNEMDQSILMVVFWITAIAVVGFIAYKKSIKTE